ncbi:MAG: type II CAAX endopeptidase family protein [Bryobacteraceae bacterium]|jgi:membrane protease YdiL (CAAX protease family)
MRSNSWQAEAASDPKTEAPAPRQWLHFALLFGALALFFAWYEIIEFPRYPIGILPAVAIYACLLLLLILALAPGFAVSRQWLSQRVRGPAGAFASIAAFLLPYLIYALGTGDFRWWAYVRLLAFAALPFGLFAVAPVRHRERMNWQDVMVLLWILTPVLFGKIGGIWNVPVNLDFMSRIFLTAVGAWSFLIIRGLSDSGYNFQFSRVILRDALISLVCFSAIAIPLGFALHFITWNSHWRGARAFAFDYLTIFLFIAMAEELFFRGLLQNLLEGSFGSRGLAQACASILFGLSHIRHAPAPNWRYVILASVAGWFYGWAYRKHRSLMASATTHALVDTIWRAWFELR